MRADKDRLYQHVDFLMTLWPVRNHRHYESVAEVCQCLTPQLDEYGLRFAVQPFKAKVRGA